MICPRCNTRTALWIPEQRFLLERWKGLCDECMTQERESAISGSGHAYRPAAADTVRARRRVIMLATNGVACIVVVAVLIGMLRNGGRLGHNATILSLLTLTLVHTMSLRARRQADEVHRSVARRKSS
jgi:hypothetical protein